MNDKYEVCLAVQQQIVESLHREFSVVEYKRDFPKCVDYINGQYVYDAENIIKIFQYYFVSYSRFIFSQNPVSAMDTIIAGFKKMFDVKNNITNIYKQSKFQAEFSSKLKEIKACYFEDIESENYLKSNFEEFYLLLEDENMDGDDIYEMTNNLLDKFKNDLKSLKQIRAKY